MNVQIPVVGTIHSPFHTLEGMPIQPVGAPDVLGSVVLEPCYVDGLRDLEGFSHIYLIYLFHKATRIELRVVPWLDTELRGVFATRSPLRPAHIGLSVVELVSVEENRLTIRGVDVLDGTPLIDIKPYVPQFDLRDGAKAGWVQSSRGDVEQKRSDDRYR